MPAIVHLAFPPTQTRQKVWLGLNSGSTLVLHTHAAETTDRFSGSHLMNEPALSSGCLDGRPYLPSRIKLLFQLRALLLSALLGAAAADKGPSPSQSYGAPQDSYRPQVKYGGPIVYSGEKPPIIHFPPPPEVRPASLLSNPLPALVGNN